MTVSLVREVAVSLRRRALHNLAQGKTLDHSVNDSHAESVEQPARHERPEVLSQEWNKTPYR